jgi:Zn-dependent protease with chaperone function
MLYVIFMVLAIAYNLKKFHKERAVFLSSLTDAKSSAHRVMILGHHFYIFIFEAFLALVVAHLITDKAVSIGLLGFGAVYLILIYVGFYLYQFFIRYVERHTNLELYDLFKSHLIRELRVNFSMIMLPILVYSLINWAFLDSVYEEWGNLWFIGLLINIVFVSVLTIVCSVVIMLRLIPNREIIEPEYLEIINKRLEQIQQPGMRVRWIETDIRNAFVVGLKLLSFSNQTMFIGKSLRTTLTLEEFDAVIAHELSHVANRHIHKRVINLIKNIVSVIIGISFLLLIILGGTFLYWGDDAYLHTVSTTVICSTLCLSWVIFNYTLLFDTIRSHEFEADAYAVMELGVNFNALKAALEKLSNTEELPDYIKERTRKHAEKGYLASCFTRWFSTHPELPLRLSFLEYKISHELPFNYYVSPAKKIRKAIAHLTNWKFAVPLTAACVVSLIWVTLSFESGRESIATINRSSNQEIMKNKELIAKINTRPQLLGQSLMYFIVKKKDPQLIDYFLQNGADKGKTLMYISQLKDYDLFEQYYRRLQNDLTDDEYLLVLRKTAQVNFTEAYRMLVNAKQFERLDPFYKEDVSTIHRNNLPQVERSPASIK